MPGIRGMTGDTRCTRVDPHGGSHLPTCPTLPGALGWSTGRVTSPYLPHIPWRLGLIHRAGHISLPAPHSLAPWVDPQGESHLPTCPTFPVALGWSTGRFPPPYLPHITRRLGLIHRASHISLPAPHYPAPWVDPQGESYLPTCLTFPGALGWSTGRVISPYLPHIPRRLGLIHKAGPISLPVPHSPAPWVDPQGGFHLTNCPTLPGALGWSTGRVPSPYLPHIPRRLGLIHRAGPISLPAPHSPAPWVDPQGGFHLTNCPTLPGALGWSTWRVPSPYLPHIPRRLELIHRAGTISLPAPHSPAPWVYSQGGFHLPTCPTLPGALGWSTWRIPSPYLPHIPWRLGLIHRAGSISLPAPHYPAPWVDPSPYLPHITRRRDPQGSHISLPASHSPAPWVDPQGESYLPTCPTFPGALGWSTRRVPSPCLPHIPRWVDPQGGFHLTNCPTLPGALGWSTGRVPSPYLPHIPRRLWLIHRAGPISLPAPHSPAPWVDPQGGFHLTNCPTLSGALGWSTWRVPSPYLPHIPRRLGLIHRAGPISLPAPHSPAPWVYSQGGFHLPTCPTLPGALGWSTWRIPSPYRPHIPWRLGLIHRAGSISLTAPHYPAPWVDPQDGSHLPTCPTFPGALGWSTGRVHLPACPTFPGALGLFTGRVPSPYLPHITRRLGLIHMADPISLPAPHSLAPWVYSQGGFHLPTCPTLPGALGWSTWRIPSPCLPHIPRRLGFIHRAGSISLPAPHSPAPWVDPQGGFHLTNCPTLPGALGWSTGRVLSPYLPHIPRRLGLIHRAGPISLPAPHSLAPWQWASCQTLKRLSATIVVLIIFFCGSRALFLGTKFLLKHQDL